MLPGFWAGLNNQEELLTSECPFCTYYVNNESDSSEFEVLLPQTYSELSKTICGETRMGMVCGICQDNYTVHFHSPGFLCKPEEPVGCRLGWLFYILSELVPVTAVFITVLVLNVSFTSGAINGFILFSQLLGSLDIYAGGITVFSVVENAGFSRAMQGLRIFYGFFNLDFFNTNPLSFCLWKGASALDMLAFKYVTILYAVLLAVAVVIIMNKCGGRCFGRCCRITTIKTSVIHGISTFLVVCYAQCIKVSLSLLLPVHLHREQNSSDSRYFDSRRVWFNGELTHLGRNHWPYAVPAIFALLTVGLMPPVLLLAYPLCNKALAILSLEERKPFNIIISSISWLKPLLDSFQGCYKDNLRFFAGLYFLYRWTFLVVHWNTLNFSAYFTATGAAVLFMHTLHTICQPYIKRAHNLIDTLLFTNLLLIISLSLFNFHQSRSHKLEYTATVSAARVQLVLIYLPLIVVSMYFVVILCSVIVKHRYRSPILNKLFTLSERSKMLRMLLRTISTQDENLVSISDEDFIHDRLAEDIDYEHFEEQEL